MAEYEIGDTLAALKSDLEALKLNDGSTLALAKVYLSIDDVTPQTFYALPVAVLGSRASAWDDENPELGTEQIWVDIWVKELTTPGMGRSLDEGEEGVNEIVNRIRSQLGHLATGAYMAAVTMIDATEPEFGNVQDAGAVIHRRVTYEVNRG